MFKTDNEIKTKIIDKETNKNEKEFLNETMHLCLFCSTDHWNIWHWCSRCYVSMLIKVMFCFSIRLEDTSFVEVNNNVKTCFLHTKNERNEDDND